MAMTESPENEMAVHAANYAMDRGFRVFPCRNKRPLTTHGLNDASSDPELVERMFEHYRGAQIAVVTGYGFWVLDVDGETGEKSLAELAQNRPIYTAVVRTARGRHYWFKGEGPRTRAGIFPGLDTRGRGGYVIAPPSIHESGWQYRWEIPLDDLAEAPAWLLDALSVQAPAANSRPELCGDPAAIEVPLSEADVLRIQEALDLIPPDDYQTWVDMGMALQSTRAGAQAFHIWDKWSARSAKYDGTSELWAKWTSFGRREHEITLGTLFFRSDEIARARNSGIAPEPPVSSTPPPGVAVPVPPLPKPVSPIESQWDLSPPEWLEREAPPPRRYLLRNPDGSGMLPLGKAGTFTAQGGIGKTMAVVQLAISVATGRPWLGHYRVDLGSPRRVLLLLGEEEREEVYRRLYYAAAGMGLTDDEWTAVCSLIIAVPLAGKPTPLLSLSRDMVAETQHLVALRSLLAAEEGWGLIVLDPLARFAGVDAESSNLLATRFVQTVEALCEAAPGGPTVLVVGHSSKMSRREGKADARGVTALTDGFRWHATLTPLEKDPGTGCTLSIEKNNYGPPTPSLVLLRREHGILSTASEAERVARELAAQEAAKAARAEKDRIKESADEERLAELAARVAVLVADRPGINNRTLRGALGGKTTLAGRAIERALLLGMIFERRPHGNIILYFPDQESADTADDGQESDEGEQP